MMRLWCLVVLLIPYSGSALQISDKAEIRLMTMEPGQEELYSAFGHSGIRLTDPANRLDIVYNYGIFDFDQPHFYLNFAKGKLLYKLGKTTYDHSIKVYRYLNRTVHEQVINLTPGEIRQLVKFLEINALPENQDYYYNYIYNNCATKIRDVFEEVFPGQITFGESYKTEPLSYRDLMDLYLGQQPWGDVGIDICLGVEIDAEAPVRDYMYLPDYLFEAFAEAKMMSNGQEKNLVSHTMTVLRSEPHDDAGASITPTLVFIVLFLLVGVLSHRELKYGLWFRWLDILIFSVIGVIGCLLFFLWFGTDHLSSYNFNILWAFPLHLVFAFVLLQKDLLIRLRIYFLITAAIQIALILGWGFLPQALNLAFVPIVLILALRSLFIYFRTRPQIKP